MERAHIFADKSSGLNFAAFILIFFLVPETKQRTLEELDYVFAAPTSRFVAYQVSQALPYFYRRWITLDRTATLEPLFRADEAPRD